MTTQGVPATEQAVEIADLRAAVAERDARIAVLEERIKDLERQMGMTSQNSSRPPSLDTLWPRSMQVAESVTVAGLTAGIAQMSPGTTDKPTASELRGTIPQAKHPLPHNDSRLRCLPFA